MKTISWENLEKYLDEKDLNCEINQPLYNKGSMAEWVYDIEIHWGDWKHEHLYLKFLLEELGYIQTQERVTEEDGSDCYSAIHRFVWKPAFEIFEEKK